MLTVVRLKDAIDQNKEKLETCSTIPILVLFRLRSEFLACDGWVQDCTNAVASLLLASSVKMAALCPERPRSKGF